MSRTGATRRLGWAITLTIAATVAIFVLDSAFGLSPERSAAPGAEPPPGPDQPWYARYGGWLGAMVRLEFLRSRDPFQSPVNMLMTTYSIWVTLSVALLALVSTSYVAIGVLAIGRTVRPGRDWTIAVAVPVVALLGWLAGTLAAAAGRLTDAVGADVLPTVVHRPSAQQLAESSLSAAIQLAHQLVFPVAVLALVLTPAVVWWSKVRLRSGPEVEATPGKLNKPAAGTICRLSVRLLPVYVAAAIAIELARSSFGASLVLFPGSARLWFDDHASNVATGVLLLGVGIAVVRWMLEVIVGAVFGGPTDRPAGEPDPEPPSELWRRLRSNPTARAGVVLLAGLALAVCYARLWFTVGPNDIVSTEAPAPPTADHWLGVDTRGRDQLVRVAAAAGGSVFVASVAATAATLLGLAWVTATARLPRRLTRPVLASAELLLAVPAAIWLALPDRLPSRATPDLQPFELALALAALGSPVTIRLLSRGRLAVPALAGTWLVVLTGALLAEHLITLLLTGTNERSPTLGALLATALVDVFPILPADTPITSWAWLWYPPAATTGLLIAGTTLLAAAVLHQPPIPKTEPVVRAAESD